MQQKTLIKWSAESISDLKSIYYNLLKSNSPETALKIRNEIFLAPRGIIFPEQFQVDEIYDKYRRIVIRNYKILYSIDGRIINIISVINSYQDSSKY
jgi:plasmid stabilization system protein ParE